MTKRWAILFVFLITACGGMGPISKSPKKAVYPNAVTEAAEAAFKAAEAEYKAARYDAASRAYENFLIQFPYNRLSDEAHYKIGKIHFINKKWDEANLRFAELAKKTPDGVYASKAHLMGGYSLYRKGDFKAADLAFNKVRDSLLPAKLQVSYFSLRARAAEKTAGRYPADYYFFRLLDVYHAGEEPVGEVEGNDVVSNSEALSRLRSFVASPVAIADIPRWVKDYPEGYVKPSLVYKVGLAYAEAGQNGEGGKRLASYIETYPKHEYVESARRLISNLGAGPVGHVSGKDWQIGVLVPLSGNQASYGQAVLWGIECAFGKREGCTAPDTSASGISVPNLVVRHSGSTPEEVARAVDELGALGVNAIIGPVSGSLAEAAAKRAQELHIVLLPITQKAGVMEAGDFIFQMGYVAKQQVADLIDASKAKGISTFGVFYPNMSYGQEMANLFVQSVKEKGGSISTQASYNPSSPDMGNEARKLKMAMSHFKAGERDGTTSAGFGALFIPDSYRSLANVVGGLQVASIEGIPLIGTNAWNDPALTLTAAGSYPGSFFLDVFYPDPSREGTAPFVSAHQKAFGKAPTSLEALGFDSARIVLRGAELAGWPQSDKIKNALLGLSDFKGLTRITGFKPGVGPVIEPVIIRVDAAGLRAER